MNGNYCSSLLGTVMMNLIYQSWAVINGIFKPNAITGQSHSVLPHPILSHLFSFEYQSRSCLIDLLYIIIIKLKTSGLGIYWWCNGLSNFLLSKRHSMKIFFLYFSFEKSLSDSLFCKRNCWQTLLCWQWRLCQTGGTQKGSYCLFLTYQHLIRKHCCPE